MVAPRPQLICLGDHDELTPPLSIERALAVTRPMYEQAGAPGGPGGLHPGRRRSSRDAADAREGHGLLPARAPARAVRYAIVGTGSRHAMYRDALVERASDPSTELVALCDSNPLATGAFGVAHPGPVRTSVGLYGADAVRSDDRRAAARHDHRDHARLPARHVCRPGAAGRLRRHHREADDDRPRPAQGASSTRSGRPADRSP